MKAVQRRRDTSLLHEVDRMLDRDELRRWLGPVLDARGCSLEHVEPTYLRAKRGVSAMLALRLDWRNASGLVSTRGSLYLGAGDRVREAAAKARTLRLREVPIGSAAAEIPEPAGFYLAFPNDRVLRGLGAAADPRTLKNRLHRLGVPFSPLGLRVRKHGSSVEPLRWKPGRRAVLRAELALRDERSGRERTTRLFLRVYGLREMSAALSRWCAVGELVGARIPRVVATDPERGFFAVEEAPGRATHSGAILGNGALGGALDLLHRLDGLAPSTLPHRGDHQDLESALLPLRALGGWDRDLRGRCRELEEALRSARRGLPAAPRTLVHGDLTADQVLIHEGAAVLVDWDEAAFGDPHGDLASLAVDLALRGSRDWTPAAFESFAAGSLGAHWRPSRWRWHMALAWARRCLGALQAGDGAWRAAARQAAEQAMTWASRSATSTPGPGAGDPAAAGAHNGPTCRDADAEPPVPDQLVELGEFLDRLLDPGARGALAGSEDALALTAVWPDGEGAIARLVNGAGGRSVWIHVGTKLTVWKFPEDPRLHSLAPLFRTGRFELAGHRLGRRAALRERAAGEYRYLRAETVAPRAYARLHEVHDALRAAGIATTGWVAREADGWRSAEVPGTPLDPIQAAPATWFEVGRTLARVHSIRPPRAAPSADLHDAAEAAARQMRLVGRLGGAFPNWLERRWGQLEKRARALNGLPPPRTLVHGDLHPGQILTGGALTVLDWERAHAGEIEEDLGNLCAHLHWAAGQANAPATRALLAGYAEGGGAWSAQRMRLHRGFALLRVLAIHSWRDMDRAHCLDTERWERIVEGGES